MGTYKRYKPVIAIDGPVGAGKSTTAREVAKKLGFAHIDTGAMYRAVTLAVLERGADPQSETEVSQIADSIRVDIRPTKKGQATLLDGVDVSERIRDADVTAAVSAVSAQKAVRERMTSMQRETGKYGGVVMDGRDIATVVFPDAELKVYLDADIEVRARRRLKDYERKGHEVSLDKLIEDIRERDRANMEREIAPLKKADDAIVIDTSEMTFDEQVEAVAKLGRDKREEMRPVTKRQRLIYKLTRFIVFLFFKFVFRIKIYGSEYIPREGGVLVAANHVSLLDPPALGCAIPRETGYFAKKELFEIPIFGSMISYYNSIPVDRRGFNLGSVREIIKRLDAGWAVLMYPEGTRSRDGKLHEPKSGVGLIATMAGVPIVPCWIEGSFKAIPFVSKIRIHFHPPFHPDEIDGPTKKEKYMLVSKQIMHYINNLKTTQSALRNKAK